MASLESYDPTYTYVPDMGGTLPTYARAARRRYRPITVGAGVTRRPQRLPHR